MKLDFQGKTAVVTGGAGGIGISCVKKLLESNAKVAIVGKAGRHMEEAKEALSGSAAVGFYELDMTQIEKIPSCVEKIREQMGEITYLVQAAGIMRGKSALEITPEEWNEVLHINTTALFFMMREVVKQSMQHSGGSIVNFSSMAGVRGMEPPMCAMHYSASKAAVVGMTMQGATEWAHYGIRVNAVAPGGVLVGGMKNPLPQATDPVPLGKLSTPEDVANTVCFLLSDAAAMLTGETVIIDGGAHIVGH